MKKMTIRLANLGFACCLMSVLFSCSRESALINFHNGDSTGGNSQYTVDTTSGDVIGKIIVGYQGWFGCPGDQSPFNGWRHWSGTGTPGPGNETFELWPDTREYTHLYNTGYAALGSGQPAKLFSDWDDQSVDLHFKWMEQYGIDCAAVQRFGSHMDQDARDKNFKNGLLVKERAAAEAHNIKFFVWYDISGWDNFATEIKTDWLNTVAADTASPMFARQDGKPVVCIWGLGIANRVGDVNSDLDVVNWFKSQGCYVIVGSDQGWRGNTAYLPVFAAADMITPWTVGYFKDQSGADNYALKMADDKAYCDSLGQDYLPVIYPGYAATHLHSDKPRNEDARMHGDFMWRQFANTRNKGITQAFIAMFDEYDEGTAIAKAAEDSTMIPNDEYFLTLDADGVHVSSDFYLRLTHDGGRMLKGEAPLVWDHPTPFQ